MKADYYKILRVSHSASTTEIKQSYRRLAFAMHPDRHAGCPQKLAEFKALNEAYQTLMDFSRRREYDTTNGHRYNRNRSSPPPPNYRKVYAPRPPPDWKFVWDHQKHYDMHYGDGFRKEAIRMMMREQQAQERKDGGYQSPLGKGFTFSRDPGENVNPFSHRPQGPPKVTFEYEEVERDAVTGHERLLHRDRIVRDMHVRRTERKRQQQNAEQHQQQQRAQTTFAATAAAASSTPLHRNLHQPNRSQECIIL
jgi:curved DNA-binding protein CbpA